MVTVSSASISLVLCDPAGKPTVYHSLADAISNSPHRRHRFTPTCHSAEIQGGRGLLRIVSFVVISSAVVDGSGLMIRQSSGQPGARVEKPALSLEAVMCCPNLPSDDLCKIPLSPHFCGCLEHHAQRLYACASVFKPPRFLTDL